MLLELGIKWFKQVQQWFNTVCLIYVFNLQLQQLKIRSVTENELVLLCGFAFEIAIYSLK